jgi:uncharacterized protein (TIGR02996 family)
MHTPAPEFAMSTALSDEDRAFLRAILNNPAEMTAWLAYIDWLDEHNDLRAEFIRLELRRLEPNISQTDRFGVIAELEDLRAMLDPDWVAIFDRPMIENCDELFAFKCPKQWEKLRGTDNPLVRDCDTCKKQVYYCSTMREAHEHAQQGHCVAVSLAVPHSPDAIHRPAGHRKMTMGLMVLPEPEPEPPRRSWWKFW